MEYNGREFPEPYNMGATSNGLGLIATGEDLISSMSHLSVAVGDQSTSGSNDTPGYSSNLSPILSSSQSQSNLSESTPISVPLGRTNLNPNAAEFVPKAYKAPLTGVPEQALDDQKSPTFAPSGDKETAGSRLDRTNSSNSNASDDEYRRFCRSQLPDDLMPDFDFGDFVESTDYEERASLDVPGRSPVPTSWAAGGIGNAVQGEHFTYDDRINQNGVRATTYSPPGAGAARYNVAESSTSSMGPGFVRPYLPELRSPVPQVNVNRDRQPAWTDSNEPGTSFSEWGSSDLTFPEDLTESVDPVTILATEFPGFASDSLADIYYANGGDLALTVDMLAELELQNEGASAKQFQPPPAPAPPSPRDFPALAGLENIPGSQLPGRTSLGESRTVPDFAAAVRKQAAQQAAQIQFDRNGGVDLSLGAVRGLSQGPGVGGFSREARVSLNERLDPFHMHGHEVQAPVAWLETGDSVANLYADMREEARDHARVRNAYFDQTSKIVRCVLFVLDTELDAKNQARQAYLTGNKALAKELSAKGQWHNEQMKAAHSKAGEAIYWQRNSNAYASNSPGQRLIDLHGLHVGEAIPLLKREIAQLRYNVRNTRQRETVFICVGTGHHTKGSRTPSRLPAAVQRYLLEEEHLQFTEPQAGMLRIVIR